MPINLGNYNFDDLAFCINTNKALFCTIDIIWFKYLNIILKNIIKSIYFKKGIKQKLV
jgi:hypothetical protein